MCYKPDLKYGQIWDLNVGYLGLQVCLSLIIANTSRILSALGAETSDLSFLWLVAPLSGLIIQPIIGHFSDKTWTKNGRRIPYIFVGIIITFTMMLFIPNAQIILKFVPPIISAILVIFLMQGALNIAMQPYRALMGDMVNQRQTNLGFSIQTLLTNIGGIIGSFLPLILAILGIRNSSLFGEKMVSTVSYSFYIGAGLLLVTNLWTCLRVKEYTPERFKEYNNLEIRSLDNKPVVDTKQLKFKLLWLSLVQFFSWFAFYYLWVYTTDGIATSIWHTNDPYSIGYNNAANWFGVLTGIYSIIAATVSLSISVLSKKIGRKIIYSVSLFVGAVAMLSIYYIENKYLLLLPMIGVGIAWSIILTLPFAIISSSVPPKKMGLYMGLFNITIVIPQIIAGLFGNFFLNNVAGGNTLGMLLVSGTSLFIGGVLALSIKDK